MIAIIMAAGEATRWNNHLDVPKHLVDIDGEPLLYRTVRQLLEHLDDVWVISQADPRYSQHPADTWWIEPRPVDTDKFYSSKPVWGQHDLLFVYGDCYFTDDAIATITQPVNEWTLYCRPDASTLTGKPWGECWAYTIPTRDRPWFEDRLTWLTGLHTLGETDRCGGWELYRAMTGTPIGEHTMTGHHIVIDDWTEDFDYPHDYDTWAAHR